MEISFSLADLVAALSPREVRGTLDHRITGIASLGEAAAGDLSFLGNPRYKSEVPSSRASVVLVPEDYTGAPAENQCLLVVEQPSAALALLCARIESQLWPVPAPGIHPSAVVDLSAQVDATATVGPLCVIEAGAKIGAGSHLQAQCFVGRDAVVGENCWIAPGVHIANACVVQDRVRLHAGVVVGSDGFGYEFVAGRHSKVPQIGTVLIESDVEIGANTTIDRARFSRTIIGQGSKIDNLVQVAHNVVVGRHCILCAQVGISGSTTLGDYVVLGGQAGVAGHITIAKGTKAGGRAGITTDTDPGVFLTGNPAMPYQLERRILILQRRLPDLFKRVDLIATELDQLKKDFRPDNDSTG